MFFKSKKSIRTITWTGEKDDWAVKLSGREEGQLFESLDYSASLAFWDCDYMGGVCCLQMSVLPDSYFGKVLNLFKINLVKLQILKEKSKEDMLSFNSNLITKVKYLK